MLQTAINLKITPQVLARQDIFDTVALPPNGFAKIVIGIYESIIPMPALQANIEPALGETVDIMPARIDENGDYTLICMVRNRSKQACIVSIGAADDYDADTRQ